jgi:hypothetical protein
VIGISSIGPMSKERWREQETLFAEADIHRVSDMDEGGATERVCEAFCDFAGSGGSNLRG